MPTLTHIPMSPKRRSEERGCASLGGLGMSDKGRAGGSCVPSGKVVKGKALPDLPERENC